MANKATRDQKAQLEAISQIDSMVTILGDYPESLLPSTMDTNPFGFLINICKSLGIFDELMNFLVSYIQYSLPIIELGVKGILLANIKNMVSCSTDPFIPNKMRKVIDSNEIEHGITFSIQDLDYNNLLSTNPMANGSEYSYLGIPRRYIVEYRIVQKYEQRTVFEKASKEFSTSAEFDNWVILKTKKYENDKRYKVEIIKEKVTYYKKPRTSNPKKFDIAANISLCKNGIDAPNYQVQEGEKIVKTVYKGKVTVVEIFDKHKKDDILYDVNYDSEFETIFDTYIEADSALLKIKNKTNKLFATELKEGAIPLPNIRSQIDIDINELARAEDFNAFLWYVIHMAEFSNPHQLNMGNSYDTSWSKTRDWVTNINNSLETWNVNYQLSINDKIEKRGPLGAIKLKQNKKEGEEEGDLVASNLLGSTFVISEGYNSAMYDLCIKCEEDNENPKQYTLVPATSDNISLNWYGDRRRYFDFLKNYISPKKQLLISPREYHQEIGICNIEFDSTINDTSEYSDFTRNQLRFTVLPKPLIHIPQWLDGHEMPWNFKMILFNSLGEYDPNGKYSVFVEEELSTVTNKMIPKCHQSASSIQDTYPCYYTLTNKNNTPINLYLFIPKKWSDGIRISSSQTEVGENKIAPIASLYECYPNLTVYEFNYDYIMSQRLFDPKVVAGQLIQSLLNARLGFVINKNITEGSERIVEVIKNMITADTYTSSDCFESFSNDKYDSMARKTEQKKAQGYHFEGTNRTASINTTQIQNILNEYDNPDLTPNEQFDVLNRAFTQVTASITAATEGKESWDVKFNIIYQLIQELVFTIVESILTPKILMILMVNKHIIDSDSKNKGNVLDNLMTVILDIIKEIIKQIKDTLLSQLLEFVLGYLKPKFKELADLVYKEYIEQYRDQLTALIKAFGFGRGRKGIDTKLDVVDYADIDPIKGENLDKSC